MALNLKSSGGGSVTLDVPSTASNYTATLPAATGTVMNSGAMPAFSAYANASQTVSNNVQTKVSINTEDFDTNSNFDPTTNYRFTPTVAGYYQVNGTVRMTGSTGITNVEASIFKNGTETNRGTKIASSSFGAASAQLVSVTDLVYLNGSTDYIELYGSISGTGTLTFNSATAPYSKFSACLVRAA